MDIKKIIKLHGKWLNDEVGGVRADLSGANLRGANLVEANLRGANLVEANLFRADLRGADMSRADLSGADLSGADLRWADLRWANLSRANLFRIDLRGADLRWADLSLVDLRGVRILNTIGDGVFIRSMQLPRYIVNVCGDWLQIGCEGHHLHEWEQFDDGTIAKMDKGALEWWNHHRDAVMAFVEAGDYN